MSKSYSQFESTLDALEGCHAHMKDTDLSATEDEYRYCLIELCKDIAAEHPS